MNAFKLAFLTLLFAAVACFAQETPPELTDLQKQLVAPWVIRVGSGPEELVVKIKGIQKKNDSDFTFDAAYGKIAGNQGPFTQTSVSVEGGKLKLLFRTQPGSLITVTKTTDELFEGTFTNTSGKVSRLTMRKVSNEEIQAQEPLVTITKKGTKPGSDVPESCAVMFGGWAGKWYGNPSPHQLWVTEITNNCKARVAYGGDVEGKNPPPENAFFIAEIKDGAITFPCANSGTCVFKRDGEKIVGTYTNPKNAYAKAVLEKIN